MTDPVLLLALLLTLLLLMGAISDAARFIIPNWLNGLLLVLYPAMLFLIPGALHGVDWLHALYAFAGVFAVGFLLFSLGVMGGGDIKLLCVLGLWCGLSRALIDFLLFSSLFGGLLTLLLLAGRFLIGLAASTEKEAAIPRLLRLGEPIPYGIAIAAGFSVVLWTGHVPGLTTLAKPTRTLLQYLQSYV